jgi:hypothetical protein
MIQDLHNLQVSLNNKLKLKKAIVYIINSYRFHYLFESASESAQIQVLTYIKEEKLEEIKIWMQHESGEINLTELRRLGRRYSITNYGRLSKRDLVKALNGYINMNA